MFHTRGTCIIVDNFDSSHIISAYGRNINPRVACDLLEVITIQVFLNWSFFAITILFRS